MLTDITSKAQNHFEVWQQTPGATPFIDFSRDLPDLTDTDRLVKIACIVMAYTENTASGQNSLEAIATVVGLV